MSVYTPLTRQQLQTFLEDYGLGQLKTWQGIRDGIENSNYFVTTTTGKYVLTLFEKVSASQLDYFFNLQKHLNQEGIPCPSPIPNKNGQIKSCLLNKPCAIFPCIMGKSPAQISREHCQAMGSVLGQIHLAGLSFEEQRHNPRDLPWITETGRALVPRLSQQKAELLQSELDYQNQTPLAADLPLGTIHADLFRDNVLFSDAQPPQLRAVLDFYDACRDRLLYDLAITVNDWCTEKSGKLNEEHMAVLLKAYQQKRGLTQAEQQAWPQVLRLAALRFWVSRLQSEYNPVSGELTQTKPAATYEAILIQHRQAGHK